MISFFVHLYFKMMSSFNSCEHYDCNEITGARDLHTGAELYSISSYEEVTDADDYFFCEGSGSSSCPDLESFCSLSSYEEGTDADDHNFVCGTSGLSSCPELESFCSKVQSHSDKASQKKRAFSKVTLTRDRKRLKPIDGEVECLILDGEGVLPPCFGDNNNEVII
jgi:hypothetical protein